MSDTLSLLHELAANPVTAYRMQLNNNQNPENDPSTFGQLVPLLLMSLTVFTFLQIVSGMSRPPSFFPSPKSDMVSRNRARPRAETTRQRLRLRLAPRLVRCELRILLPVPPHTLLRSVRPRNRLDTRS
jgi:hypothetical protein